MLTESTVDDCVASVLAGQTERYSEIVALYQREVWRVVMAMLHDMDRSQELVEQTFVEAYLSLNQYQRGRNFGVWLKSIARNVVRQELRKLTRQSRRLEAYRDHLKARLDDDAVADAHDEQMTSALAGCSEKLPSQSARVLALRYQENKSFEEIAAELGRTVDATRQLLSRIRISLRECIDRRLART